MTDNTTPRELSADELAAIRTLADAAEQTMVRRQMALNNWSANPNQITEYALDFLSDNVVLSADGLVNAIRRLLAHIDALAANGDGGRGDDGSDGNGSGSGEAGT